MQIKNHIKITFNLQLPNLNFKGTLKLKNIIRKKKFNIF